MCAWSLSCEWPAFIYRRVAGGRWRVIWTTAIWRHSHHVQSELLPADDPAATALRLPSCSLISQWCHALPDYLTDWRLTATAYIHDHGNDYQKLLAGWYLDNSADTSLSRRGIRSTLCWVSSNNHSYFSCGHPDVYRPKWKLCCIAKEHFLGGTIKPLKLLQNVPFAPNCQADGHNLIDPESVVVTLSPFWCHVCWWGLRRRDFWGGVGGCRLVCVWW